jgi:hypothetical protein
MNGIAGEDVERSKIDAEVFFRHVVQHVSAFLPDVMQSYRRRSQSADPLTTTSLPCRLYKIWW